MSDPKREVLSLKRGNSASHLATSNSVQTEVVQKLWSEQSLGFPARRFLESGHIGAKLNTQADSPICPQAG